MKRTERRVGHLNDVCVQDSHRGSPILAFFAGGSHAARAILICCGGVIKHTWRGISDSRPSQRAQRTGHPLCGDATEIRSLGHPPNAVQTVTAAA
jgi:hypothetical protein